MLVLRFYKQRALLGARRLVVLEILTRTLPQNLSSRKKGDSSIFPVISDVIIKTPQLFVLIYLRTTDGPKTKAFGLEAFQATFRD